MQVPAPRQASAIGVILLFGLVAKNAILLVENAGERRAYTCFDDFGSWLKGPERFLRTSRTKKRSTPPDSSGVPSTRPGA